MTRAKVRECPALPLLRLHREQKVELVRQPLSEAWRRGIWVEQDIALPWWARLMLWDWRRL